MARVRTAEQIVRDRAACRAYYAAHRAFILKQKKEWADQYPNEISQKNKKWAKEHPDRVKANREFRRETRGYLDDARLKLPEVRAARYAHRKKPESRERNNARQRQRLLTDINFRLSRSLRGSLGNRLRIQGVVKDRGRTVKLLGCSIEHLRQHLEKQFKPGMTWANWGEWHIDHKKALMSVDLTNAAILAEVCHYSNLQPLWASENIVKGKNGG